MINVNGIDWVQYFGTGIFNVKEITGRGPLSREINRRVIPGRKGSIRTSKRKKERKLGITFTLKGDSLANLREKTDELSSILNTEDDVPITFSDEPDITYFGIYGEDPDWKEVLYRGEGTIYFICSDPDKIGSEKTYDISNDTVTVVNNGSAETKPVIKARFSVSVSDFIITHSESGKSVRVIRNFAVNDVLEVDFPKEKIILNGIVSMPSLDVSLSDFFDLKPGNNTLTITPAGVATTEITFKERWL